MENRQLIKIENTISNINHRLIKILKDNDDILDLDTFCKINQAIDRLNDAKSLLTNKTK